MTHAASPEITERNVAQQKSEYLKKCLFLNSYTVSQKKKILIYARKNKVQYLQHL